MIKLSIIIPIYNIQRFVEQCVNSVLKQNYNEYEVILVDDGSKDLSGIIADKIANNNNNVKVYHKENGGLSDTRNYGIKKAKGEYLLFVDGDDFIKDNVLGNLVNCIEKNNNPDVIFLNICKWFNNAAIPMNEGINSKIIEGKNKEKILKNIAKLNKFPGSACTKLVKRKIVLDNNLFFEKGLLSEDIDWVIRLLNKAETFAYCNHEYYFYRQNREGSITNNVKSKNINDLMKTIVKFSNKETENKANIYINSMLAFEYSIVLANYMLLNEEEQKKVEYDIFEYFWILSYGRSKKTRIIYILSKIVGKKRIAKLLALYLKYRKI